MTVSPNRRSTKRGRPLVTDGAFRCSRCQRMANQRRASWPGEQLCYSCFYAAMKTRGICPQCSHDGIFPGLAEGPDRRPICLSCARIAGDFTCRGCGIDGAFYRRGSCARSLKDSLAHTGKPRLARARSALLYTVSPSRFCVRAGWL